MSEQSYGALIRAHMNKRIEKPWTPLNKREQATFIDHVLLWITVLICICICADVVYRLMHFLK